MEEEEKYEEKAEVDRGGKYEEEREVKEDLRRKY